MPNDYSVVRQVRKGPKITMGKGMTRVEPDDTDSQNRSKIVIEPNDEQRAARDVEIQQRGGKLHDTIKIDPFSKHYQDKEFGQRKPPVTQI